MAIFQVASLLSVTPDAAAQQKATQAQARKSFLARLGTAKECQPGGQGGKHLSAEQFQEVANNKPVPLTAAAIQSVLAAPVTLLPVDGLVDGKLDMKGKRFYIAEFRVLFDVGGQVSASKFLVMAPTGMKVHSRGFAGLGAGNIGKRIEWSKSNLEALSISVAVNIAALESFGSGMTMIKRESSASAGEGMSISMAPDTLLVQSHAHTNILRMNAPLVVDGSFASFREVGGYDTDKDTVGRTMGLLTNLAGMGANKTRRTDTEVDLDGPATGRMALQGLATINQAIAERIKAGM